MSHVDNTPSVPGWLSFERGFTTNSAGCLRECACGKWYYTNGGWDWEEGELDALAKNPNAYARDYAIGEVAFEGKVYANACDCWHPRALQLIKFIDGHARAIAEYLTEEKKRKTLEAERSAVVR